MIKEWNVYAYCCEDISLIENYDKAINDKILSWHCHHRKEIQEDGTSLSSEELKKRGMFFNQPAKDLIFLTPHEHISIHKKGVKREKKAAK